MARFVAAVRRGALVVEAAREAGVTVATLYRRRKACGWFAAAWDEAAAASAGPQLVCAVNGRTWQLVRGGRRLRFGRARKQVFLDRFAATCNLALAARAAGVHPSTVHRHLARDPAFAAGFAEALATGYAALEAEGVRQGIAAQEAYRIGCGTDDEEALAAQSFERTMQLLREYKRGGARIGPRPAAGRLKRWSFDRSMAALETQLRAFGVRIGVEGGAPA
jgi:transposase-like protein